MISKGQRPLQHNKKVFPVDVAGIGGDWNYLFKESSSPPHCLQNCVSSCSMKHCQPCNESDAPNGKGIGNILINGSALLLWSVQKDDKNRYCLPRQLDKILLASFSTQASDAGIFWAISSSLNWCFRYDCPLAEMEWHLPFDLRRNIGIIFLLRFQNGPDGAVLVWILNPGIWRLF